MEDRYESSACVAFGIQVTFLSGKSSLGTTLPGQLRKKHVDMFSMLQHGKPVLDSGPPETTALEHHLWQLQHRISKSVLKIESVCSV